MKVSVFFYFCILKIYKTRILEYIEKDLISRLKNNDSQAFDDVFKLYYKQLCYYSFKIVKDKDIAEEIVQDLFVQIWEKRNELNINISLKSYLYRSVHNNSIRQFKKEILTEAIEEHHNTSDGNYDSLMEQAETEIYIYNTIEQLPEHCRNIFKMSRFENLKYREIAEKLNISVKTVETQMSRALKFLTKNLQHLVKLLILFFLSFF